MTDTQETISIPVETSVKGLQTFTINLDMYEMMETGSKIKDGKIVMYIKFRVMNI